MTKTIIISDNSKQRGFAALIMTLIILSAILVLVFGFGLMIINEAKVDFNFRDSLKSYYLAEGGIEDAVYRLSRGMTISGNYNLAAGDGSSQISISGTDTKTIDSLGDVRGANRKIRVVMSIQTINPQFYYGVQVGQGGLTMDQNSRINGNIYSDGIMTGSSGSVITGDATVATGSTLGESSSVQNQDQIFGQNSPVLDMAQQFSPNSGTDGPLAQVSVYLKKVSNPSNVTVRILTDNGDTPTKTVLASATLDASSVGATYSWIPVAFSSPPTLVAGTKYWITIDASANPSRYWVWGRDSNNGYGNGIAKYSADWNAGSPVWSSPIIGDLAFRTLIGGEVSSLNNMIVHGTARANTIINSRICGDAYYQSIDADTLSFVANPTSAPCPLPLTPGTAFPDSSDPAIAPMPITQGNINDWEAAAEAGGVYNAGSPQCAPTSDMALGPARLNCDWVVGGGRKITINGPVWVNGDITISNNSALILNPSFGNDLSTVVIADAKDPPNQNTKGKIITSSNVAVCGTEGYNSGTNQCNVRQASNKSYIMLLSTYSGATGWAVNIENNVEGAIFYASNGAVDVGNNVTVKEVTAYKLQLENNAAVTYESGLYDAQFSSGPGAGWALQQWKEIE